ncbi:asparagine synthase (glutamine-hydrolyzing) [Arvimicrobium flavum]|uniref:asparagine synthase (glutamine-hydrolyzing) n=1 Tax=Arvimicrobium flavum TaxID=3393320 RepID=UPI00237B88E6|nr:asparagine synthase (glutamine-hydrolyzing) [Mesorhizobium shangrilense]
MCGICGFVSYRPSYNGRAEATLRDMTAALAHRGPDAGGTWLDPECQVGLGHRRLSIVDLSELGAQPMHSASGRYTIVFNGEIYGFLQLRDELASQGVAFRGRSDTEVLLAAVEMYGLEETLRRCNGMFAFALFDRLQRTVTFARDRLGKKPLYVALSGASLCFSSELKGIRKHPDFANPSLDMGAVTLYARYKYVPAPYAIYDGVLKMPPGSFLSVSTVQRPVSIDDLRALIVRYWDVQEIAERSIADRGQHEIEAMRSLESTLRTSVSERMVSDVSVGAFLSGGVDSSLVTAVMQEMSPTPIRTFTVRFHEKAYNEADVAAEVARCLRTDHTEITASPRMALDVIGDLAEVYDEPFADPSQIPTLVVSRLAREHVTVALSGDGGDELFGGYARYQQMLQIQRLANRIPRFAFRAIAVSPIGLTEKLAQVGRYFRPELGDELTGDRLKKLADLALIRDFDLRYLNFLSEWNDPSRLVIRGYEPATAMSSRQYPEGADGADRMMFKDTVAYLPDDILVKVDRASMSVGLELRAPLLDYRLVEAAWRSPRSLCISNGQGKVALRKLLLRHLPKSIVDRPKRGFGVPINDWLRGPVRSFAEELLSNSLLQRTGVFDAAAVRQRWSEHLSGRRNWGPQLWTILVFNAWHSRWMQRVPA